MNGLSRFPRPAAVAATLVVGLALGMSPPRASAELSPTLDQCLVRVARAVQLTLKDPRYAGQPLKIDAFEGLAGPTAGIPNALRTKLEEGQVLLSDTGTLKLGGVVGTDVQGGKQIVFLELELRDLKNRRLTNITDSAFGDELFGTAQVEDVVDTVPLPNVDLTKEEKPAEQQGPVNPVGRTQAEEAVKEAVKKIYDPGGETPTIHRMKGLAGAESVFLTEAEGVYGIEILTDHQGELLPTDITLPEAGAKGGAAFPSVDLGIQDVYAIRVYNRSNDVVAVRLTIDGLHVFDFSEEPRFKNAPCMFVHPGTAIIKGWYHKDSTSHAFTIGHYADSRIAGVLGEGGKTAEQLGIISAHFFYAAPALEEAGEDLLVGTAAGAPRDTPYGEVKRKKGASVGVVGVRYPRTLSLPTDLPPPPAR
ncbi:hypothetical protein [Alienimonas chondri]|uniref:Uncharacterized protein n=1 Tax=Alienimonas chondri TaxID=2681879 RepID=A0ABX1VFI7_9PLAN|nr:hypothetical protein [Alienimonas chondri]NNJ26863.1 hypothetical protein [Alienimonas chondri]